MIGNSNNQANLPNKLLLLLTNTQVSRLRKAFVNNSSAHIKLWKTQLPKMVQLGGFLDRLLGPILKTSLPFIKNAPKPSMKNVLKPF